MQITEVTVSWTETANLGNYSNVRPSLSLKATIDADDDPAAIQAALTDVVKGYVREQVDQALEQEGQAAKYSTEPRFDVIVESWGRRTFLLIVPRGTRPRINEGKTYPAATKYRLAAARAYCVNRANEKDTFAEPDDAVVALYDASSNPDILADAIAAITEAKAAYDAEQAEKRRQQEESWEAEKQRRLAERERERAERTRALAADTLHDERGDDEDEADDDDE